MIAHAQQFIGKFTKRLSGSEKKGLKSVGWTTIAQLACIVTRLTSMLVLTRLLVPEAYAIIGTAIAVMTTLEFLSDVGVTPALVRHPRGDKKQFITTGWMIGLIRSSILTLIAMLIAYPYAWMCRDNAPVETLFYVLLFISLKPLLVGLKSPAFPLLKRRINFKAIAADESLQVFVQTAVSIGLALWLRNVWALAIGMISGGLASTLFSYYLCRMRPQMLWDAEAAKEIYGFSKQVFVNTLLMAAWMNMVRLLGLKFVPAVEVGYYMVAWRLAGNAGNLVQRVSDVQFTVLSDISEEDARLRSHKATLDRLSKWLMPMMGLAILMAPVATIILPSNYQAVGMVFAVLVARLMMQSFQQIQFQYLMSINQVRLCSYAYIVAIMAQAVGLPLLAPLGAVGMALCMLSSSFVMTIAQTYFTYRHSHSDVKPVLRTTGWMFAGLLALVTVCGNPMSYHGDLKSDEAVVGIDDETPTDQLIQPVRHDVHPGAAEWEEPDWNAVEPKGGEEPQA